MPKHRIDEIIGCGFEILDLALTAHDERKRRRLDPSDGQHKARVSCTPHSERICARKVHPDQPVGACTCKCRQLQREKIPIVAQVAERIVNALIVERVDEDAAHGLLIAEIVEHLIHKQLPLTVRVSAVYNLIRTRDQCLHHAELLGSTLIDNETPLAGQDRQILRTPAL